MDLFAAIYDRAAERRGGAEALEAELARSQVRTRAEIAATPADRLLAAIARVIFPSGLAWSVVEAKWPGIEAAFEGFDVARCARFSEADLDRLLADPRIIRHGGKVLAVQKNAQFLERLAGDHGSAGHFFAHWPEADIGALHGRLKAEAARLGGEAGPRFLRAIGKPTYVLTKAVCAGLVAAGAFARPPGTGKADQARIRDVFNAFAVQSGRDLTVISRVLAMSVPG